MVTMTPARFSDCLETLRWPPSTLAQALGCEEALVNAWMDGTATIPVKVHVWLDVMARTHAAAEQLKPTGFRKAQVPTELVPAEDEDTKT